MLCVLFFLCICRNKNWNRVIFLCYLGTKSQKFCQQKTNEVCVCVCILSRFFMWKIQHLHYVQNEMELMIWMAELLDNILIACLCLIQRIFVQADMWANFHRKIYWRSTTIQSGFVIHFRLNRNFFSVSRKKIATYYFFFFQISCCSCCTLDFIS